MTDGQSSSRIPERRGFTRTRLTVEVSLASESHFFAGLSGDLSRGGIFVSTYEPIEIGREVQVEFDLPTGQIVTRGIVRWIRAASEGMSPGVGIGFTELSPNDRLVIERFCAERPPLYVDVGDRESIAG
jgi:uncharacterized protein (TIGR02266 family)